jgi:hypothetical protein
MGVVRLKTLIFLGQEEDSDVFVVLALGTAT